MNQETSREAAFLKPVDSIAVSEAIDRNADVMGDAEALVGDDTRLSWRQVKQRTDRMALALLDLGLGREDVALVQMPNGVDLFTIRVACEKAGVRLVSAPVSFREAELRAIIEHVRPSVALVKSKYRDVDYVRMISSLIGNDSGLRIVAAGETCASGAVLLEELLSTPIHGGHTLAQTKIGFFDVAEIQTTSGSTGVPKCVDVPIASRFLTGYVQAQRYRVTSSDVIGAFTPLTTGTSNSLAYYNGARLGAKLVLPSHFNAQEALEVIEREKVTVAIVVPTMLAQFVQLPTLSRDRVANLRVVVSHGALLVSELAQEVEARTGAKVVQAYGSADYGGICATCYDDPSDVRLGTVGKPLDGNELRLVDDLGRDVPRGEVGRILVRGAHAVAGYHRNPALQAESWATGFFDTQEFGQMDAAGNVVLAGRLKDIIIRGGQNIYPADVENLLAKHPKVAQVAAIGIPDKVFGERVCACVVLQPGQMLTFQEMAEFLRREKIAPFKLPERLEVFQELPKGTGGLTKVDKTTLRKMVAARLSEKDQTSES
ncbi:MAG: AMP-binding protein [Chloroflexi bacterium]|nr:AMP-binding protein [Chloroflexota bacterium]MDA8189138.1 AMP-binding protein [Dehalococcoidales bacterium]